MFGQTRPPGACRLGGAPFQGHCMPETRPFGRCAIWTLRSRAAGPFSIVPGLAGNAPRSALEVVIFLNPHEPANAAQTDRQARSRPPRQSPRHQHAPERADGNAGRLRAAPIRHASGRIIMSDPEDCGPRVAVVRAARPIMMSALSGQCAVDRTATASQRQDQWMRWTA